MKKSYTCIKLNTRKFKRKRFFKNTNKTLDNEKLLNTVQKLKKQILDLDSCSIKSIFIWENATIQYVEINPISKFYDWFFPINFSSILALILEILQNNINFILEDREKTFELIYKELGIDRNYFYLLIKYIQILLIKFKKVKICKNGDVIIMNDLN